jgi:hypothetical protein
VEAREGGRRRRIGGGEEVGRGGAAGVRPPPLSLSCNCNRSGPDGACEGALVDGPTRSRSLKGVLCRSIGMEPRRQMDQRLDDGECYVATEFSSVAEGWGSRVGVPAAGGRGGGGFLSFFCFFLCFYYSFSFLFLFPILFSFLIYKHLSVFLFLFFYLFLFLFIFLF